MDGTWEWCETQQPELDMLTMMNDVEWAAPPPLPPPPEVCYGMPRVQYQRTYNVIPEDTTDEQAVVAFLAGWRRSRETAGGSYDVAAIGDLEQKRARLYGIEVELQQVYRDWFAEFYPSTQIDFVELS